MSQTVAIAGGGTVEFPDTMDASQIEEVLRSNPPPDHPIEAAPADSTDSPALAGAKAAWQALNAPIIPVPRTTGEELKQALPFLSEGTANVIAGAQRGAASLIEGVENPLALATAGAGVAGQVGMKVLGGIAKAGGALYGAMMAKNLPASAAQTEVAFQQGDVQTGVESAINTVAGVVLTPTIAGHLAPGSVVARIPERIAALVPETSRAMGTKPAVEPGVSQEAAAAPLTAEAVRELPPVIGEIKTPEAAPKAGDAATPVPADALVGMGGATPGDFVPVEKFTTANKNAVIDQEREARGLPPMAPVLRRSWGTVLDEAQAKADTDPGWLDRLTGELLDKPRPTTDTENAGLDLRRVDLRNEFEKAAAEGVKAADEGRPEDAADAAMRANEWSDKLAELEQATGKGGAGTELGRGLASRRMMLNEDFSLAALELKARAARNFEPLTDTERANLQKLAADHAAKSAELEKVLAEKDQRIASVETQAAIDRATAEANKTKASPHVISLAEKIVAGWDVRANAARARLREKFARTSAGVDPTILIDLAEVGLSHLGHVGLDFARWSAEMIKDFGEAVRPHLEEVFKRSQELSQAATAQGPEKTKLRRVISKEPQTEQAATGDAIKAKVQSGDSNITGDVQKLVRGFVEQGITDRVKLVEAVHAVLQEADPEITFRDTMDAISGYGKYKLLTKDDVSVQVRDIKGQLQQVAKLEDMQAGKAPAKTGIERRTPSDEERRLIKQVEEAKKKGGYNVTDPATQLRSALQERETRLTNQISDLQHEIENKARIVKGKTEPPTSPKIEELTAQRDALRAERDKVLEDIKANDPIYQAEVEAHKLDAQRDALLKQIAEQERRLREGDIAAPGAKMNRPADPVLEPLRQQRDALREQLAEARKKPEEQKAAEALANRLATLEKTIAEREAKVAAGDISSNAPAPRVNRPLLPELEQARQRLEAVNAKIAEMRKAATAKTPEQIALQAMKTRMTNRMAQLQAKLDAGDFSKTKRVPPVIRLDPEATKLQSDLAAIERKFQQGLMADKLKKRTTLEKVQDTFVKWRRAFLLSSPVTLAKLTSAAVERTVFTPLEELAGGLISKIIPSVARRAPVEGGLSIRAEARALTQGFTQGMKDAWSILKTGRSELDAVHGKEIGMPRELVDFIGEIHGALKAPTKRNAFERAFQKQVEAGLREGVDVRDPLVQSRYAIEAYKAANRSIFLQDNVVVSAYRRALSALEQPDKATGKVPLGRKLGATAMKVALPIVRVPTNIVAETFQYAAGSVTGSIRLARAMRAGIENLPEEQADLIMRELKKGSLGAAALLVGYFSAETIGGYYQPGEKRRANDVKAGTIRIYGQDIPSFLVHNPLLETLQIGATVRRVADSKLSRKDPETQGVGAGIMAAALGLLEEVPFARETMEVGKMFDPHSRGAFLGEFAKSTMIPQIVQWEARREDVNAQGEPIVRKPRTVMEHIKTGIPGLRQGVPEKRATR